MAVSDDKERVNISLDKKHLEWVDEVAARFGMTRSQVVSKCIVDTQEVLALMDRLGAKPERVVTVIEFLAGLWSFRTPRVKQKGDKISLG